MVEGVLMKQVRLVEEKDGVESLFGKVLDLDGDGVEDGGGGGTGLQPEGQTELAIEVVPAEGGVTAVGEPESIGGKRMPQSAQHARFPTPGSPVSTTLSRASMASTSSSSRSRCWAEATGWHRRSPR